MKFDLASAFWLFLLIPIVLWVWHTLAGLLINVGGPAESLGKAIGSIT